MISYYLTDIQIKLMKHRFRLITFLLFIVIKYSINCIFKLLMHASQFKNTISIQYFLIYFNLALKNSLRFFNNFIYKWTVFSHHFTLYKSVKCSFVYFILYTRSLIEYLLKYFFVIILALKHSIFLFENFFLLLHLLHFISFDYSTLIFQKVL